MGGRRNEDERRSGDERSVRWRRVAIGAVAGVAWAAALRGWMTELVGPISEFRWAGTFIGVLLPGVVVGTAFGWAATVGREATAGQVRMLRWCAAAPLAFAVAPLALPGALVAFLTQGLGGGALAIAGMAIAGGYALGGGTRTWARITCGILAFGLAGAIAVVLGPAIAGGSHALTTPRGAWLAMLVLTLLVVLFAAASIPFARLTAIGRRRTSDALRPESTASPAA